MPCVRCGVPSLLEVAAISSSHPDIDDQAPQPSPTPASGEPVSAGRVINDGKARVFPCSECGADLTFSIGQQRLQCPYCGHVEQLAIPPEEPLPEQDLNAMLDKLEHQHVDPEMKEKVEAADAHEVHCDGCGANVVFTGTLTATKCPYCGAPIQLEKVQTAEIRIAPDGVLPFLVPREAASQNLKAWVQSLWFAPNDFKSRGVDAKFEGVYLPYFTFDAMTYTRYTGSRGDHYWVTEGSGNNQRRVRRTRWTSAWGEFQRFFDDIPVLAMQNMSRGLSLQMEPWPLEKAIRFTPDVLAGFFARTYDLSLRDSFEISRKAIENSLDSDVRKRIGGDEQSISSMDVHYSGLTFKHLLLPTWLLAYRYKDRTYQVMINAATGKIAAERPYSWVKITFAVLAVLIVVGAIYYFQNAR